MMTLLDRPHTVFASKEAAAAQIALMGFEDGETCIVIDPLGSGRAIVDVLDAEDGAVIGRL